MTPKFVQRFITDYKQDESLRPLLAHHKAVSEVNTWRDVPKT